MIIWFDWYLRRMFLTVTSQQFHTEPLLPKPSYRKKPYLAWTTYSMCTYNSAVHIAYMICITHKLEKKFLERCSRTYNALLILFLISLIKYDNYKWTFNQIILSVKRLFLNMGQSCKNSLNIEFFIFRCEDHNGFQWEWR